MKVLSKRIVVNILLIIALAILSISSYLAYHQLQTLFEANRWVIHTHRVIETAYKLQNSLIRAESRINFYLINHDKETLKDYLAITALNNQYYEELNKLTIDNPEQQKRLHLYKKIMDEKLILLNQVYAASLNNHPVDAANTIQREKLRRESSKIIQSIIDSEYQLINLRNDQSLYDVHKSNLFNISSGLIDFGLFILAIILLNYHLRQLRMTEEKKAAVEKDLIISNKHLKESEERYLLSTQGGNVGIWDWTPNTDSVIYSDQFVRMLGYSRSEFPNTIEAFNKCLHPDDYDHVWTAVSDHLENHTPFKVEFRLKTKLGGYRWFQSAGKSLLDKNGKSIRMTGSITDITDRKKLELLQTIQYSIASILAEYENLEDAAKTIIEVICKHFTWEAGAMWVVNPDTFTLQNANYWQHESLTNHDLESKTKALEIKLGEGLPGEAWKRATSIWIKHIQDDKRFIRRHEAKKIGIQCGLFIPILLQNTLVGIIELYSKNIDKSEDEIVALMESIGPLIGQYMVRKQAENRLRSSETFKTAILEAALDSIITTDEHGIIISCNPQTAKIFGYLSEEIIHKNINVIMPNIESILTSFIGKSGVEYTATRKNKEIIPIEISISKMYINKQYIFVIIIRDITDRKKVDKMKSEFISVVSHELRTPITSIRGSLSLVLGKAAGELPAKAATLLEIANHNCDRLLVLINDILDIEKLEAGKMVFEFHTVKIADVIKKAISTNMMYAEKFQVTIRIENSIPDRQVKIDENRILQVLANLISNAAKFSPTGESIIISVKEIGNHMLRISVTDHGSGIPDNFKNKIFQRFSQADSSDQRSKNGTGLGLNISKSIIEKHGGTINYFSESGKGSTFYFDLPISDKNIPITDETKPSEQQANAERLLVCDDDEDVARYIGAILESRGYIVDLAFNAATAKEYLQKNVYHAILLDLMLPDTDGITLIRELKNNPDTNQTPVIVLSVIAEAGKALLNGDAFTVLEWLEKPIDFNRLLTTISNIKKQYSIQKPHILHIEDDTDVQLMIKTILEGHSNLTCASSLAEAKILLSKNHFDFVILDLVLPDGNGVELIPMCSTLQIPIIIFSNNELDEQYSKYVHETLTKSKTSNDKLLDTILKLINPKEIMNE